MNVIDGDPDTYWEPEPKDLFPPSYPKRFTKWWIEMDLGKLVNAVKVVLRFAEDGDPSRQFSVYISDGNMTPATYGKPLKDREFSYTYIEGTKRPVEGPDAPKVFEFYLRPTVRPGEGFAYTMSGQRADLVRYVRIVVTDWREGTHSRLADIEVWSTGDNIALGIIRRGGSFTESEGAPHRMVDGMLDTYWRASTWFPYRGPKPEDWAWVLIDLGATFWVDRYQFITFFPPGGSWWYSLLRGYIVEGSDGSRAPDGSPIWRQISPDWRKYSKHNPKRILLFEDDFPLQKLRYLTIRNYDITGRAAGTGEAGMLGELMLYGRGYVSEVELESPLIELGGEKNLSVIEWDADVPPGTKLEVQTRTGDELRQILHYYNKAGKEITPEQWARLIGVLRGPVDTVYVPAADWSGWSRVYERSGQVVTSPSPRKYMTIRVRMLSDDPEMCVELRSIRVRFTQPIARRILGEVVPSEDVELGRRQEFSFYVRPLFSVSSVRDPQGRVLTRARYNALPSGEKGHIYAVGDLMEVRFRGSVYMAGSTFRAQLGRSDLGNWQRVDPGDASVLYGKGSTVVSGHIEGVEVIGGLEVSPMIVTPNGDGFNDEARIRFSVFKVGRPRRVGVEICDLGGRVVRDLSPEGPLGSGSYEVTWDCRNGRGRTVPPGVYIVKVSVYTDAGRKVAFRTVSVTF